MKTQTMENNTAVPILIPLEPQEFWDQIRLIIREEVTKGHKAQTSNTNLTHIAAKNRSNVKNRSV